MQVIACYGYDIMQIWKMGRKKLKFTRIEKNGQCLNECMALLLGGRFPQKGTVRHCVTLKNQVSNALR